MFDKPTAPDIFCGQNQFTEKYTIWKFIQAGCIVTKSAQKISNSKKSISEKVGQVKMRYKREITALILIMLILLGFIYMVGKYPDNSKLIYSQEGCDVPFGEITDNCSLVAKLDIDRTVELNRISILLATYGRDNTCEVHFYLYKNGEEMYSYIIEDASALVDDSYFTLDNIGLPCSSEDEIYLLITSPSGQPGNAITVWMHSVDTFSDTYAYNSQTNEATNFGGMMGISLYQTNSLLSWMSYGIAGFSVEFFVSVIWFITLCITAVLLFVFIFLSIPVEKVFAIIAVTIGLVYLLVITPLSPPDELTRYYSSYRLSNYLLFQWENAEKGNAVHFDYSGLTEHQNVASGYRRIVGDIGKKAKDGEQVDIGGKIFSYDLIELLPQVVGISLARLANLNLIGLFLSGRACNLFFYSLCIYFAVKRTPRFKFLFGLIGIMPMALHQAASLSYDGFINGISLILIASLLKAIYEDGPLSKCDYSWIVISGMLLVPAKLVYTAILLLVLLIPKERFNGTKARLKKIVCLFVCCAVMLVVFQLSSIISIFSLEPFTLLGPDAVSGGNNYTISYIFEHPLSTAKIFKNSFVGSAKVWFFQSIGMTFSGMTLGLPMWIMLLFCGLAVLASFSYENSQFVISGKYRAAFLAVAGVVTILIMLAEFLGWTDNTSPVIEGIQGRYFTPILPLLFMSCNNQTIVLHKSVEKFCVCAALLLHMSVIFYVLTLTCG